MVAALCVYTLLAPTFAPLHLASRVHRTTAITSSALSDHASEVARLHERLTQQDGVAAASSGRAGHNARQASAFDEAASFFASSDAVPAAVWPALGEIATAAAASLPRCDGDDGRPGPRVLDVGTGTGALLPFYEASGIELDGVTGVDLSGEMLAAARERFPAATFVNADLCDLEPPEEAERLFDAVVFNAVFGNVYDQGAALAAACALLKPGGRLLISHPLGASFVRELRASDPSVVPHELPSRESLARLLLECGAPLRLVGVRGDAVEPPSPAAVGGGGALYLATLEKSTGVRALPSALGGQLPLLRGPVATGFGRGSRKLGIPTANLPCSLFQEQLAALPCGVYVGWASVRGAVHKCVCNLGFSPTFVGAENPEKIVEAHLMARFDVDFYEEPMGLLLLGYIRDERKFGGLDELLATIKADIATASAELERTPLAELAAAPVLLQETEGPTYQLLQPRSVLAPGAADSTAAAAAAAAAVVALAAGDGGAFPDGVAPRGFEWGPLL